MLRNLIAAFAAPAIALVAIGISAAVASNDAARAAYGAEAQKIGAGAAEKEAGSTFDRADLNKNGVMDVNEYASLAVVTAELARLNGFVAVDLGTGVQTVSLPITAPSALSGAERARVDAVARRDFYRIAGKDELVSKIEFASDAARRFADADRNRNGVLAKKELAVFAMRKAFVERNEA